MDRRKIAAPPGPVLQPQRMTCRACRGEWEGKLLVQCPLEQAAAYMRGLICPGCGAGSGLICLVTGSSPSAARQARSTNAEPGGQQP